MRLRHLFLAASIAFSLGLAGCDLLGGKKEEAESTAAEAEATAISVPEELKAKFKEGSCCAKAAAAGKVCDHPCCKEAIAKGEVCAKCNS